MKPSIMAMVAGIAPDSRTSLSTALAVSIFIGYSIPWVIIVDSSPTIAFLSFNPYSTSSLNIMNFYILYKLYYLYIF